MCLRHQGKGGTTELVNGLPHKRIHFKLAKIIFEIYIIIGNIYGAPKIF